MKRGFQVLLVLVALLVIGWVLPGMIISKGTRDAEPRVVAERAYQRVLWNQWENPLGRLVFTAARVTTIERLPGHCRPFPSWPSDTLQAYRATVQMYGPFGIPEKRIWAICGAMALNPVPQDQ